MSLINEEPHSSHAHDEELAHLHHGVNEGFGDKGIGSLSGGILMWNNITGPALVQIPLVFLQSGLLVPLLSFLLITVLSSFAATAMASAMKRIPGNRRFHSRIEFSSLARYYLGSASYWSIQVVFNLSLLSLNLVSILLTIAVMDWTLIAVFGRTCALRLTPEVGGVCVAAKLGSATIQDSPFGNDMVISLGFLVVLLLIIPMGYFSLDENIWVQVLCFIFAVVILIDFVVVFLRVGLTFESTPLIGPDLSSAFGTIILNYAFITTVPSWVNEKQPHVSVNSTVWWSVSFSTLTYLVIGLLGAWAFPGAAQSGGNILAAIRASSESSVVDAVAVYLFPMLVVASSIPIYGIIIRYNLVENELCSKNWANIWAQVLPWVLAIPLTAGNAVFNDVVNWTSLVFQSIINLLFPFLIYYKSLTHVHVDEDENGETAKLLTPESEEDDEILRWSERYPRLARTCCTPFVLWMDKPKSSKPPRPSLFSLRNPRLARWLPARLITYLDREKPEAPEHHMLPRGTNRKFKKGFAVVVGVVLSILVVVAIAFNIEAAVVLAQQNHTNTTF